MFLTITLNPTIDIAAATDHVAPERKLRCDQVRHDPGGGGINVARVLTRLGAPCQALFLAGGMTGARLRDMLAAAGLSCLPVETGGETRQSLTVFDRSLHQQFRFVLPGPPLDAHGLETCLDAIAAQCVHAKYVIASGSLPPGAPDDLYGRIAALAAKAGARFVLDTSGAALAAALEQGVHIVKPNLRELSGLVGRPLDSPGQWEAAAAALVAEGKADIVALSLGAGGAFVVSRGQQLRAQALDVPLKTAVGAGDSFLAAFVHRLAQGGGLDDALRHGVAAGAAALMTEGTSLAQPADIARLAPQVVIDAL